MNESKMTRILVDLSEKQDYNVFYLIDVWQTDKTKKIREIIKISDLANQFKNKEGYFYKKYRIASDFRELVKHLEKKEEMRVNCYYKDSYESYMNEWKKNHPNEDYEIWVQEQKRKREEQYNKYLMRVFGGYGGPYGPYLRF